MSSCSLPATFNLCFLCLTQGVRSQLGFASGSTARLSLEVSEPVASAQTSRQDSQFSV